MPGLTEEDVAVVWAKGTVVTVPAGWSMIHEHEPPDNAYLILEGRTRVTLDREKVADLGPGDFVGEIAPIAHRLRTATVTAVEPLRDARLPRDRVRPAPQRGAALRRGRDRRGHPASRGDRPGAVTNGPVDHSSM